VSETSNSRRFIVPGIVILGVIGLSIGIQYGRGMGPTGRAAGSGAGCNAGSDLEAAKMLVNNPEVLDLERVPDPSGLDSATALVPLDSTYVVKLRQPPNLAEGSTGDIELDAVLVDIGATIPTETAADIYGRQNVHLPELFSSVLVVQSSIDPADVMAKITGVSAVEWSEPKTGLQAMAEDPAADLGEPLLWNHHAIHRTWVMENTNQGKGVTVSVMDSGYTAGVDGIADVVPSHDYVDGDDDPADEFGHGTLIASVIAERSMNTEGFAGVAPEARIRPVRILDRDGKGNSLDLAAAIVAETIQGADVILMSIGGYHQSMVVSEALDYAHASGVILVGAVGNDGLETIAFPASHPAVIAVGAVDPFMNETAYSNKSDLVDILAPGGDMTADADGDGVADGIIAEGLNGYHASEGTSFAAAHVAAIAAIVLEESGLDRNVVRQHLMRKAGDDRVIDPQKIIEGVRDMVSSRPPELGNLNGPRLPGLTVDGREFTSPDEPGAPILIEPVSVARLPMTRTRAEITWETPQPADASCTTTGGRTITRTMASTVHRLVVGIERDMATEVTCRSFADNGQIYEIDAVLTPPGVEAPEGLEVSDCMPLEGHFDHGIHGVKKQVTGEWCMNDAPSAPVCETLSHDECVQSSVCLIDNTDGDMLCREPADACELGFIQDDPASCDHRGPCRTTGTNVCEPAGVVLHTGKTL
jgi:subtilisin family serine protease